MHIFTLSYSKLYVKAYNSNCENSGTAFTGCMYDCQTHSKYMRWLEKTYGAYFNTDKLYKQLYSKHFKKFYAGKPTKRYLRILKQVQQIERTPFYEIGSIF